MSNMNADWEKVKYNPTLYPKALEPNEGQIFKWHSGAHSPYSSQTFCVSAFGSLRFLAQRNRIISRLFSTAGFTFPAANDQEWNIRLEYVNRGLLNEKGSVPTNIDAFCCGPHDVICIEAKFKIDATDGFGGCSQVPKKCQGFFGPGSDRKKPSPNSLAWCRLEKWDGKRSPRLYWYIGREYFRPEVFQPQSKGDTCPFAEANYQLMRNFLFSATFAKQYGQSGFAVLAICPKKTSDRIREQVEEFKDRILLPCFKDRLRMVYYEDYIDILRTSGVDADQLADFLSERISNLIKEE